MSWIAVAGVAVVGVGAAVGASGAAKAKQGPDPRGLGNELEGMPYNVQQRNAQALVEAQMQNEGRYASMQLGMNPAFARQNAANQRLSADTALDLYPRFANAERRQTSKTRASDVADLDKYGGAYASAFARNSPGYAALLAELGGTTGETTLLNSLTEDALGMGRSPLAGRLEADALREMDLGDTLSPEQERNAQQAARQAWAARGLGMSNGAIGTEVLNRDAVAAQRLAGRRQFAGGVQGLLMQEDQANRGFGLGVEGARLNRDQARRGFLLNASSQTNAPLQALLGTRDQSMGNAFQSMSLGMPVSMPAQISSQAPSLWQGTQALQPLWNYGADVYNTNLNMRESRNIRNANGQMAIGSGLMSAGGSMGGAGMGG